MFLISDNIKPNVTERLQNKADLGEKMVSERKRISLFR